MPYTFFQKSKGFTLLELVVVVAIIGLLASIALIPNLIRFQQRAVASKIKAAAVQLQTAYVLAGTEGCTNFDIAPGGVVKCDVPFSQVYIQAFVAQPASGPQFDFDLATAGFQFAAQNDLDPNATSLTFEVRGFLESSPGTFSCSGGSCNCSAVDKCQR